ncbi:hypothetical protein BDY19DRAFT_128149 [Irpex rosettiformis]|uniref:Uncharacterized protein n=1 Tax=Irpex rosettiformis TaxID=378272 RepID=A0ACB8U4K1_9APHY|nr:hypothetical protein BDY19DRAFT_128149 [Irpex rosettiformis]
MCGCAGRCIRGGLGLYCMHPSPGTVKRREKESTTFFVDFSEFVVCLEGLSSAGCFIAWCTSPASREGISVGLVRWLCHGKARLRIAMFLFYFPRHDERDVASPSRNDGNVETLSPAGAFSHAKCPNYMWQFALSLISSVS